ncbi:MAG: ribonuclease Y [Candidatus Omnitrophota bacterium]
MLQNLTPAALILIALVSWVVIFFLGYAVSKYSGRMKLASSREKAKTILEQAKKEAENARKEAELEVRDAKLKMRSDFEQETKDRRQELAASEKRLTQKEENLDRKVDLLDGKERKLGESEKELIRKQQSIESVKSELDQLLVKEKEQLQRITRMTAEEAKRELLARTEKEVRQETGAIIKRVEDETKELADKKARNIISMAMQRCAAEHTAESTVSVVSLPNDEMKGRIIGREGRNIRALETAAGVDVIVDDTPEAVTLSSFDMVRREVARISLERLIEDGRIHPGRIEEVVEKVKKEMEITIKDEGEKAAFDLNIHGLHPEIIKLLGRLKYRTSYGQNVLQHSKEAAYLMGVLASEVGLDFNQAKRIGLLHDLGKAVSYEVEGPHAKIGADLARKYRETEAVIHAIEAHHQDIEARSVFAVLVQVADAISATRPGARRETLESYVKRLETLEAIADSFKGVAKSFAIQGGREVRIIVQPDKLNELEAITLARDITKKIEEGLEYPGQIKVTVVRETRAVEYAK